MDKKIITLNHLDSFTKTFYEESRRLIRSAMAEHNLIIFVGAGVSLDSGMPSWSQAISQIAKKLDVSPDDVDNLKIPQYYFNARGKNDYTQLIHQIFKYGIHLQTMPVHKKIIEFNADVMITTNYDHLLEQAEEESGEILYVASKDSELPYKRGAELIKMHGDFEHDNFVLKEDDYLNYEQNFRLIKNYITSLAGTKTILFIGYSFNDPDLKQIFSWLKNILLGDFRHAYMISVGQYDRYEENYYKNFGINTLYASLFQNDGEELSKTEGLNRVLDWLLQDDFLGTIFDELWRKIGVYHYMKVPYANHVIDCLKPHFEVRIDYSDDFSFEFMLSPRIPPREIISSKQNSLTEPLILFSKFCYVAHKSAGEYSGKEKVESTAWYKEFENYVHNDDIIDIAGVQVAKKYLCFSKDEWEKVSTFLEVMVKSGLSGLLISSEGEKIIIPLSSLNEKPDDILLAMENFDFQKLENFKDGNEQLLSVGDADSYLKQAHLCYLLEDYVTAYFYSKKAAYLYFHQNDYARYFIAKCNQKFLGDFIHSRFNNNEAVEKIKEELERLDLNKIFMQIPDLTDGHAGNQGKNEFLKEIYSFSLAYNMLQNTVKEAQKVEDEANSNYIIFGGTPAYQKIRAQVKNFYHYIEGNHLFIDRFEDIKMVFGKAASALISSALAEDKIQDTITNPVAIPTKNIHETEIQVFDLFLAIRYLSDNEIEQLFQKHNMGTVSSSGMKYLSLVYENLANSLRSSSRLWNYSQYLSSLFAIIGHIKLEDRLVASALSTVIRLLSLALLGIFRQNFNAIRRIVEQIGKQQLIKKDSTSANSLLQLADKILEILPLVNDEIMVDELTDIMSALLWNLNEAQISHDRSDRVKELLQNNDYRNASFFIYTYRQCSENTQRMIREWIKNWNPGNSVEDYRTYLVGIQAGAISMSPVQKEKIVKFLKEQETSYVDYRKRGILDSRNQSLVRCILNLVSIAIIGKVEDKTWIIKICKEYQLKLALWLLDMNNEDNWKDFQPEWLNQCDSELLQRIAENKQWCFKIATIIKKEYLKRKIDEGVIEKYFRYFA